MEKNNNRNTIMDHSGHIIVTWMESGDEIHLLVLEYLHWPAMEVYLNEIAYGNYENVHELLALTRDNQIESKMFQSYVLMDVDYSKYNIKKIIHIPDFGC